VIIHLSFFFFFFSLFIFFFFLFFFLWFFEFLFFYMTSFSFVFFFFFFFLIILFPSFIDHLYYFLFLCHKFKVRITRYTSCGKQLFHIYDLHLIIFLLFLFRKSFFFLSFICTCLIQLEIK